jgi:hypothetical protein
MPVQRRDPHFIDPKLSRLVGMNIVDRRRKAYHDAVFNADQQMVSGVSQALRCHPSYLTSAAFLQ